jgi:glycosyltransferase involved in cell wall biosynthesis
MLAPEFVPVCGGVGTYVVELVKHLPKTDEIHIIAPTRQLDKKYITETNFDFSQYFSDNVHLHFICKAKDTFFYNGAFQYFCSRKVPKLVKDEKIDVIHSHTAHMPDLLLMLRNLHTPTVTTVHTTIQSQRTGTKNSHRKFTELERSEKATYMLYPFLRLAEKAYFSKNRFYISPSEWMKRTLEQGFHLKQNIAVIPNSVDVNAYQKLNLPPQGDWQENTVDKNMVLYVGRLLAMKGVNALLEAVPKILEKTNDPKLLFVFAGPGDETHYVSRAKALNVEAHCLFTGLLPKQDVFSLMRSAKLVVAPSLTENMPFTVLESMACGAPVIAGNVGGVSEVVEDGLNGKLLASCTPNDITQAVVELLADESLRKKMGVDAQKTIANKFSWTVNAKKYSQAYADAVND